DLYSLGCTFYFLLTGEAPFAGRAGLDKLAAHGRDTPPPLRARRSDVPETALALVEKLLAKQPEDRYPSSRALVEALDTATAGMPVREKEQAVPAGRTPRRRRLAAGVGLLALVAVAVPLAGVLAPWQPRDRAVSPPPAGLKGYVDVR